MLTVVAVVVFLPVRDLQAGATITTNQYTALEQEGRDLYVVERLHLLPQPVHPPGRRHSTSKPSEAGEFVYDNPHQLGTLRTGPDLANIGLKRGDRWEIDHLRRSAEVHAQLDHAGVQLPVPTAARRALVAYLNRLGNKQNAHRTDLMIPAEYLGQGPAVRRLDVETWDKGREIYAERCLTCHGCAGKGDGPYAMHQQRASGQPAPASLQEPAPSVLLLAASARASPAPSCRSGSSR